MNENKRFKNVEEKLDWGTIQYFTYNDEKITDDEIKDLVNQLLEENDDLKKEIKVYEDILMITDNPSCEYQNITDIKIRCNLHKKYLSYPCHPNISCFKENCSFKEQIKRIVKDENKRSDINVFMTSI